MQTCILLNYPCKQITIEIYLAQFPSLAFNLTPNAQHNTKFMFIKTIDRYHPQILIREQTNFSDKAVSTESVGCRLEKLISPEG